MKATQKSAKSTKKKPKGFTDEQRAAKREHARGRGRYS
jgi:hypothetical protein